MVNTSGVLILAAGINVRLIFSLPIHALTVVTVLNVGEALCVLAGPDFNLAMLNWLLITSCLSVSCFDRYSLSHERTCAKP